MPTAKDPTRDYFHTLADIKKIIREIEPNIPNMNAHNKRVCDNVRTASDKFYGDPWPEAERQLFEGLDSFKEWMRRARLEIDIHTLRRRRIKENSDIEGDILDADRLRYSDFPMTIAKKRHVPSPIIKLMVSAAFSCSNSADAITSYGLKIYEIVNTLEAQGKTVELSVFYNVCGLYCEDETNGYNGKDSDVYDFFNRGDYYDQRNCTHYVKVKNAGEYIEPSKVAVCLTAFFFRRVMWQVFAVNGQKDGLHLTRHLGFPRNKHHSGRYNTDIFKLDGDCLWIEPNDAHMFDEEMVEKGIQLANRVGITNETEMLEEQTGWR